MIDLLKEYKIDAYITNRCLRRNYNVQKALLDYLVSNDIELIVDNQFGERALNPIINASTGDLKEKYKIDLKKIIEEKNTKHGK